MIAASKAFSLFTAYQFLSSDMRIDTPESKMRPYPSCVYQRVCSYMLEMIATSFFFVYCVSNFEFRFYFKTALTTAWRRVTIQHLRRKEWATVLSSDRIVWPCICYELDHIVIDVFCRADHMRWLVCFLSALYTFLRCRRSCFRVNFTPQNDDHISFSRTRIWPHSWP